MKKYIIVLFSLLALSTSCTDYLDKQPDDMKTDEMVWSSRMETEKYLANCYGGIPTGHLHQHEPWVGAADECNITWNLSLIHISPAGNRPKRFPFGKFSEPLYPILNSAK